MNLFPICFWSDSLFPMRFLSLMFQIWNLMEKISRHISLGWRVCFSSTRHQKPLMESRENKKAITSAENHQKKNYIGPNWGLQLTEHMQEFYINRGPGMRCGNRWKRKSVRFAGRQNNWEMFVSGRSLMLCLLLSVERKITGFMNAA